MADYITRDEFEAAIAALQCVGDQQTIDVTQSPGGQTIRNIQVIGDDADVAADTEYVSVSYDSGTEKFTVTVTDLPVLWVHDQSYNSSWSPTAASNLAFPINAVGDAGTGQGVEAMSDSFVFDKPASGTKILNIMIAPVKTATGNDTASGNIYWSSTTLTSSTAATQERQINENSGSIFAKINILSDGTYSITTDPINAPVLGGYGVNKPYCLVDTDTNKIYLRNFVDPLSVGTAASPANNGYSYSAPFNAYLILGYTYGASVVALDISTSSGSYDEWWYVAYVDIDANNNVKSCETINYNEHTTIPHIGWNGTFSTGSNTVYVKQGLIYDVT